MGIFDKAESEAENMAQKDPNLTQQADQSGDSQSGQDMQATQNDMQTAQNTVGPQGGYQGQDQGQNWQ